MKRVVVIGGGITGLSAAWFIQSLGSKHGQPVHCTILEAGPRAGGKVWTSRENGFLLERGPDSFITQKPHALDLCRDLGLGDQLLPCRSDKQKVYVLKQGRLLAAPSGFRLAGPTDLMHLARSPLFSWGGKVRMALEPLIPARRETTDESIASFVRRRFGSEALRTLAGPMMSGIFMGDPEKLSMQSSFPMLQAMEKKYGSLIKGFRTAAKNAPPGPPAPMFVSLRDGMDVLIHALEQKLGAQVRVNTLVKEIYKTTSSLDLVLANAEVIPADAVILASPCSASARLIEPHQRSLSQKLGSVPAVSSASLSVAFPANVAGLPALHDSFGFLAPENEDRIIRACTFTHCKFDHRCPEGFVLLRAFAGGSGREHRLAVGDDALAAGILAELREILGVKGEPVLSLLTRWEKANPQFMVGHAELVAQIQQEAAALPGISLACNGLMGPGLPDRIEAARQSAHQTLQYLFSGHMPAAT